MKKSILTIAGSDPSGGAGLQRDLKTFDDFGLEGLSVITAVTSQNHKKVHDVFPIPADSVIRQIETLFQAYRIHAVKLGMLATGSNVLALAHLFKKTRLKNVILDPVFTSSSGFPLLDKKGIAYVKKYLLPHVTLVTPNLDEAAILAGMKRVSNADEMKEAAIKIKNLGPLFVLVKGGHLRKGSSKQAAVSSENKKATDILYDGKGFKIFSAKRIERNLHGTGCILSAAIASCLALGMDMFDAVKKGKEYTTRIIQTKSLQDYK